MAFAPLAEELRRAGRLAEAVQICRAGLALHPEYATGRATLGRALLDQNELDAALAELEAVLAAAPQHLAALKGVAEIHARRGASVEALATYRRAHELAREDVELARAIAATEDRLATGRAGVGATADAGPRVLLVRRLEQFLDKVLADRTRRA